MSFHTRDFVLLQVANEIQTEKNLDEDAATIGLRFFDIDTSPAIRASCPWTPSPRCNIDPEGDDKDLRYRRHDGSCNNLKVMITEYTKAAIRTEIRCH